MSSRASFPPYLKAAYTDKDKRPRLVWDDAEAKAEEQTTAALSGRRQSDVM